LNDGPAASVAHRLVVGGCSALRASLKSVQSAMRRPQLTPGLTDVTEQTLDVVLEHLRLWRADTAETVEALRSHRREIDGVHTRLESPGAVYEYVDFFESTFAKLVADLDRILEELAGGLRRRPVSALRQMAGTAAIEQRRCLQFRDKWVNRPLPYEQVRPLLTRIASITQDQLSDYEDMTSAAAWLASLSGEGAVKGRDIIGRRELFSRLLRRDRSDPT
jgi:hypothetical protein